MYFSSISKFSVRFLVGKRKTYFYSFFGKLAIIACGHEKLRPGYQISKFDQICNFVVFCVFLTFLWPLVNRVPKNNVFSVMFLTHLNKRISIKLIQLEICSLRKLPQEKMIKITKNKSCVARKCRQKIFRKFCCFSSICLEDNRFKNDF